MHTVHLIWRIWFLLVVDVLKFLKPSLAIEALANSADLDQTASEEAA